MTATIHPLVASLCSTVQHNCSISDATYAQHYSLCVYLLRMRDFYQWRFNLPLHEAINSKLVGNWIGETESHWDKVEQSTFLNIELNAEHIDPFDTQSVNAHLNEHGLIYTAGIGRFGQPHFLVAKLNGATKHDNQHSSNTHSFDCGAELARDSINLPAMTQGNNIYIRHDSIRRWLWQMVSEWRLQKKAGPVQRLVEHFNWHNDQRDDASMGWIVNDLSEVVLNHELGEVAAGHTLGTGYGDMVHAYVGQPSEILLRSVRDIVADTLSTLPAIQQTKSSHHLDFWLAGVKGIREKWLTDTGLLPALKSASSAERLELVGPLCQQENLRWSAVSQLLLARFQQHHNTMDVPGTIDHALYKFNAGLTS